MTFFELIANDHHTLKLDLENLIEMTTPSLLKPETQKASKKVPSAKNCLAKLKAHLIAHSRAEEATLYDRLRTLPNRDEAADEQIEEHHQIEEHLEALEKIKPDNETWAETLSLLKNVLESHLAEEESRILPMLELALEGDELDNLARRFETSRNLALESMGVAPPKPARLRKSGIKKGGNFRLPPS